MCPSYGTLFFTHRQRHGDATDVGMLEFRKSERGTARCLELPPARGGEREWSRLSLHRFVVLFCAPPSFAATERERSALPPARGGEREWSSLSLHLSDDPRPWSIGNRSDGRPREAHPTHARDRERLAPPESPALTAYVTLPSRTSLPTQFAAAERERSRTPPRTRRRERVVMPLPASLSWSPCIYSRDRRVGITSSHR